MGKLTPLEEKIYNNGERLIPGVTHDFAELLRHRSSYVFFKKIIEFDLFHKKQSGPVRIVDLGCGVGHGCYILSEITNSLIHGVDMSGDCLEYARTHYAKPNISYGFADLTEYINNMPEFDYAVSRHVFEHIQNGIQVALSANYCDRMMLEVPYNEGEGNPHHLLLGIREEDFPDNLNAKFFFQDLDGFIYNAKGKREKPNGIIYVDSGPGHLKTDFNEIKFPVPPSTQFTNKEIEQFIQEYKNLQQNYHGLQQVHQNQQQNYHGLQQVHQNLQQKHHGLQNLQKNYHGLQEAHQNLQQNYHGLQQEHQNLQQNYQDLQQSKVMRITRKLRKYSFLMKLFRRGL